MSLGRFIAAKARTYAEILLGEHVPTGTLKHDEVTMSRGAIESLVAKAFTDGYEARRQAEREVKP